MDKLHKESRFSWFRVLSLVWMMIFALQWVHYTESFFFDETTRLIYFTLIAVVLIEAILPIRRLYRVFIEMIALSVITYKTLVFYDIYTPVDPSFWKRMIAVVPYLTPYVWFVLATWIIVHLIDQYVRTRTLILLLFGANLIAFAILDSFTSYYLWQETAWIVFAGMGWLVSHHFYSFRQKYPLGWRKLRRSPLKLFANIAIIFSIIIIVGVNMPEIKPTFEDPYVLWEKWRGESVIRSKTNASGPGILRTSGDTSSGYSRDDRQLGGGFNYDFSSVMSVRSSVRSYWRGETRAVYSGQGWVDEPTYNEQLTKSVNPNADLVNDEKSKLPTLSVEQTITMLTDQSYPVLFGAYSIRQVNSIDGKKETSLLQWNSHQRELYFTGGKEQYPKTYTITSEVPIVPVEELRTKTFADLYGQFFDNSNLQIPADFPQTVVNLAKQITAQSSTPYEKVALLQNYLVTNFKYTNNPDLSRKKSNDFVESFLFDIKEGYCDYYSTALVMMSRSLGIPARWVKGYAPGQAPIENEFRNLTSSSDGPYLVTNADAHSWAEVYFGDYGWIPVEATPGFAMPLLTDLDERKQITDEDKNSTELGQTENASSEGLLHIGRTIVWIAATIILLWLGFIVWRSRSTLRFQFLRIVTGKPLTPEQKVVVETERWIRFLRRKGLKQNNGETLRESALRWAKEWPDIQSSLDRLLNLFEKARYSSDSVRENEWQLVQVYAAQLKRKLKGKHGSGSKRSRTIHF
ncbi:transglutaminase domain-containing protein [Paenibacillus sediminis]|uniref:Transglutaminase-like putative cysteine protease n=1 Tax=Paenibacillus sediminis TaxID=664909 RepID=A0ABS4GYI9_9BACL|nr:transglutaminase domain-containing protein [Paenibacillus sediminis]MBP1935345.1 transglutaminase-like putative cysteine protease [Paenibacillus sediminis]